VTAGQSYYVTISAVSQVGEGEKSNPLTIWAIDLPDTPSLTLTDTSRDSCSLQWTVITPPGGSSWLVTGYIVYIDDGLDGDFVRGYDGTSNPSQINSTISGLNERTIYRLKVVALNKAGEGPESEILTCFTVTVPGQPGTPELVSSTDQSIEIKWTPAYDDGGSPIAVYEVEMDEVEGLGSANIETWENKFTGAALTYEITTGLTATMQYRFRVRAISEYDKQSLYSDVSTFYAAALPAQI
jgi:hypothetical protein